MWAGLHFLNGYSPILPAGIAREFDFRIHGEINSHEAEYLVWAQSNSIGLLALLGVDGLVVARDSGLDPALGPDWEFVTSTGEGGIYHRIGPPLARVRSVTAIDSKPSEQFAAATVSEIDDSRNYVTAEVDVPSGSAPALVIFSRPYFRGYEARLGNQKLRVDSHRSLFPMVEVPAGAHGKLMLAYRPRWLIFGGVICCLPAIILGSSRCITVSEMAMSHLLLNSRRCVGLKTKLPRATLMRSNSTFARLRRERKDLNWSVDSLHWLWRQFSQIGRSL